MPFHHPSCDLIGVGNPIVDLLARVDDAFLETLEGAKGGMVLVDAAGLDSLLARLPEAPTLAPGGSAGNTTFAATRLGLRCRYLGKTGSDATGVFYRDRFKGLGGDPGAFKIAHEANGRCLSLITPDSERTLRTCLGAAVTFLPEEVEAADFQGARHAHLEGYLLFNPDLFRAVLATAKAAGCTVSLDLASFEVVEAARSFLPDLLASSVDIVFANEEEAAAYFQDGASPGEHALAFARICSIGAVKVGKDGAFIARGDNLHRVAPVPVERPVDTTGAGDLWAAGFLAAYLRDRPLPDCGALASAMGAAVVQQIGSDLPDVVYADLSARFPLENATAP